MPIFALVVNWTRNIFAFGGFFALIMQIYSKVTDNTTNFLLGIELWVWSIILLVLASLFTILEYKVQIFRLPSIAVDAISDEQSYRLHIENRGGAGVFKGQLNIIKSMQYIVPHLRNVEGYWLKAADRKSGILSNQDDDLLIATFETMQSRLASHFHFIGASSDGKKATWFESPSYNPFSDVFLHPWYIIKVTISSEPRQVGRTFSKTYILDGNGLREISARQLNSFLEEKKNELE